MHAQVNGNQEDVFRKDVHLLGPAAHSRVTTLLQLWVEECVEHMNRWKVVLLATLHKQIHVKVDDLKQKKIFNGLDSETYELEQLHSKVTSTI